MIAIHTRKGVRNIFGFRDFIGKFFTTKTTMMQYEALKAKIVYKEYALQSCISLIANALAMSEFQTFQDGMKVKGENYYLFNIEPNLNQNATEFWLQAISKLIYDNECLIIQRNSQFFIADSFTKVDSTFKEDEYKDIVIKDLNLNRSYTEGEVLYLKFTDKKIKSIIDGLFLDYAELLGSALGGYKKSHGRKGILRTKSLINEKDKAFFDDLMNNKFKKFFESDNAVLPLTDGYNFDEIKSSSNVKDSRDIRNLINDILEIVASAIHVPIGLIKGDVVGVDGQTDNFLMFCVNPFAKIIENEINRKYYGKDSFIKKSYVKVNTQKIKAVDIEKLSKSAEVLFRIGVNSIDDNLEILGREPIDANWSKERYVTKNYQSVEAIQLEKNLKGGEKNGK